jgi:hypothetical protein
MGHNCPIDTSGVWWQNGCIMPITAEQQKQFEQDFTNSLGGKMFDFCGLSRHLGEVSQTPEFRKATVELWIKSAQVMLADESKKDWSSIIVHTSARVRNHLPQEEAKNYDARMFTLFQERDVRLPQSNSHYSGQYLDMSWQDLAEREADGKPVAPSDRMALLDNTHSFLKGQLPSTQLSGDISTKCWNDLPQEDRNKLILAENLMDFWRWAVDVSKEDVWGVQKPLVKEKVAVMARDMLTTFAPMGISNTAFTTVVANYWWSPVALPSDRLDVMQWGFDALVAVGKTETALELLKIFAHKGGNTYKPNYEPSDVLRCDIISIGSRYLEKQGKFEQASSFINGYLRNGIERDDFAELRYQAAEFGKKAKAPEVVALP